MKKREHITSIVALLERVRADIIARDEKKCREHLERLNELTKGFVKHSLDRKKKTKGRK